MTRSSRSARLLVLALVAASTMIIGVGTSPAGSVAASNQRRVTATSPTTGVTYSMVHSCMTQFPSATATTPDRNVFVNLEVLVDGVPFRNVNDIIDSRSDDVRLDFQRRFIDEPAGTDGVSFRIRDGFDFDAVQGSAPFLTLTPQPCPDYVEDERGAYSSIDPTRTLDTRPATAVNYSGPKPAAGSSVEIPASAMPQLPDGVVAVSLTATIVAPEGSSFVQVFPTEEVEPGGSSNVNAPAAGVNVANSAVVPVASDGSISVFTSERSHLLVDINGYFVAADGLVAGGRLVTVEPTRVFDTRPVAPINSDGRKPAPGATTTVDLTIGDNAVPPGAAAAAVNVTAVATTGAGFVQVARGGELEIGASSILNVGGAGQTTAGLTIVPVSDTGTIDIFTLGGAHLLVDVFGYFTADDAETSETGLFVPLTPERIFDSRRATSMNPNTFTSDPGGCCSGSDARLEFQSIADQTSAVFLNATAIARGERGFIQIGSRSQSYSNVNHAAQGAAANAALVPLPFGATPIVSGGDARRSEVRPALVVDITGYFTD